MNKLFLLSIVLPEPALLTHISALPSIPCFVFCAVVLPPRMNFLFVPIRESFCESSLSVCLPAFLPISRVDIAQHTSAYTHNCISYSNTPNTGCPVLGVHISDGLKRGAIDAKNDILSENAPAGNTADAFFRSFICFEVCISLLEKDAGKQ